MATSIRLMTHVMVLSACLGGIYGIECYLCSYDNNSPDYMPACNDPFDVSDPSISETVTSCDGVCSKTSLTKGNMTAISRECHANKMTPECDKCSTNDEEGTLCFHCCDTNRCNSAVSMTYDLRTSVTVFAFSLYWTFL